LITIKTAKPFQGKAHRLDQGDHRQLGRDGYAFANVNANPDIDKEKRKVSFTF